MSRENPGVRFLSSMRFRADRLLRVSSTSFFHSALSENPASSPKMSSVSGVTPAKSLCSSSLGTPCERIAFGWSWRIEASISRAVLFASRRLSCRLNQCVSNSPGDFWVRIHTALRPKRMSGA